MGGRVSTHGRRQVLGFGLAAAVALAASPAPPAVAQEAGRIAGRVVDAAGGPVAGAQVVVSSALLPDGEAALTSDASGAFGLGGLEPGFYTVAVEADGFRRGEYRDLAVSAGTVATVEVALEARAAGDGGY
jgi:hypothetical protein